MPGERGLLLAAGLMLFGAAGCGLFRGSLPPRELYRLALPDTSQLVLPLADRADGARRGPLEGSLAIAPYRTPGVYGGQSIVYRIDELQYGTYPSREWAQPLTMMLGAITERTLRLHPISAEPAIYEPPTRLAHPYTWQGTVREFEEVNRGRDVFVSVVLEVRIVRSADQEVVWQGSEKVERPVPEGTMNAIVQALSDAAAETVARLAESARAELATNPPTTARH